ncbi:MAG: SHOCT domain-containing protein [Actinomycetota bacterium]|nr:SHOCT domain-containing protein [Actinomycetota bacterium]
MGLIRKSLYLTTGGLVAPNSRKQRIQMQQLAALQGATDEEVRRRGGRGDVAGILGLPPASVAARGRLQGTHRATQASVPQEVAVIRLSCGHVSEVRDPRVIGWLSVPDSDLSYRCPTCGIERAVDEITDPAGIAAAGITAAQDTRSMLGEIRELTERLAADDPGGRAEEAAAPSAGPSVTESLERLAALHSSGALTDAEFQAAKAKLLSL